MTFYNKEVPDGTFCLTGYKGEEAHVVLPTKYPVTILNDSLFKGHTEIQSVEIPDTVTQIGGFVFEGCTSLKTIKLPSHLKDMWQYAFTRTSLEEIEIPGSVKAVIPFTFNQSNLLKTVTFNEGTIEISAWAFKDCTALTDVYLPKSLTKISENAFEGCDNVKLHYK